jgi:hypothetical protein
MKSAALIAGLICLAAAESPASLLSAYRFERQLTPAETAILDRMLSRVGAKRIASEIFTENHVVLIRAAEEHSAELARALAAMPEVASVLKPLPVEKHGESWVILPGRYLVYFQKTVKESVAERFLVERHFKILHRPTRWLPAFSVRRAKDARDFARDLEELKKISGVRGATHDSLTVDVK